MKYKRLGRSGLQTSALSVGGWKNFGLRLNERKTELILNYAVDNGINTFDTADVYGPAEEAMGKVLRKLDRNKLVISSKCYWPMSNDVNDKGLSRKHIKASVHNSLKKLQTDFIDIYLCHRFDEFTPLRETISTFNDLIREGKILYWGTSSWSAEQILEAYMICEKYGFEPPIVEQAEYSLVARQYVETHIKPVIDDYGLGLMCWSPLASGILAGKNLAQTISPSSLIGTYNSDLRNKYHNPENLSRAKQLEAISHSVDLPMATLALSWLLSRAEVSNIVIGVSTLEQLQSNIKAISTELNSEIIEEIETIFSY